MWLQLAKYHGIPAFPSPGQHFGLGDPRSRPDAPWPLRWLGEEGYDGVLIEIPDPSEQEVERVRRLFPEAHAESPFLVPPASVDEESEEPLN